MNSPPETTASLKGARGVFLRAPAAEQGSAPRSGAGAGRQRYVVGVFVTPSDSEDAIMRLAADGCDVLVVSDGAPDRSPTAETGTGGRVIYHPIDTSATRVPALAPTLAAMLRRCGSFSAFGAAPRDDREDPGSPYLSPPGMQRLFQNLVHHLAMGATVVVVQAPGAEQQLSVSHALLGAKCDVLLTHDVLPMADGAAFEARHGDEACCEACDSKSCRRIGASQDGTAAGDGTEK